MENLWRGILPLGPRSFRADELLTSYLDRAAALHGVSREQILMSISEGAAGRASEGWDWDLLVPQLWRQRIEEATGLAPGSLHPAPGALRGALLKPGLRRAYCPLCFQADLEAGQLPHFRVAGALVAVTHCAEHRCPLCLWTAPGDSRGTRTYPEFWLNAVTGLPPFDPIDDEEKRVARRYHLSEKRRIGGREWLGQNLATAQAFGLASAEPTGHYPHQVAFERARWAALIDFEREVAGLAKVEASVLKKLEPGSFSGFVGDLYSIATTRFSPLVEPAIRCCSPGGDGMVHNALYFRWRRALIADRCFWHGELEDWRAEGQPEVRRAVLLFVNNTLEEHLGRRCQWLDGQASDTTLASILRGIDGAARDWLVGRARGWPDPVRGDVMRLLKLPTRLGPAAVTRSSAANALDA